MKLEALRGITTKEDFTNMLSMIRSMSVETGKPVESFLKITDSPLPNTSCALSFMCREEVLSYLLTYEVDNRVGLARLNACDSDIIKVTEPVYIGYNALCEKAWLAKKPRGAYDLVTQDGVILTDVMSYDILCLGNFIFCIQVDTSSHRYLICDVMSDVDAPLFFPSDMNEFTSWFSDIMYRFGYEGYLDEHRPSDLFRFYFEVCNCIFMSGRYKKLEVH